MQTSTPIPNGEHVYFTDEAEARAERRMYINSGHSVSLIAGEGDGYGFDVYDLWTEREAWGIPDPDADAKLHRGEWPDEVEAEDDPAEHDPEEAAPIKCSWWALCPNQATTTEPHPILGDVPICSSCAAKVMALS